PDTEIRTPSGRSIVACIVMSLMPTPAVASPLAPCSAACSGSASLAPTAAPRHETHRRCPVAFGAALPPADRATTHHPTPVPAHRHELVPPRTDTQDAGGPGSDRVETVAHAN